MSKSGNRWHFKKASKLIHKKDKIASICKHSKPNNNIKKNNCTQITSSDNSFLYILATSHISHQIALIVVSLVSIIFTNSS